MNIRIFGGVSAVALVALFVLNISISAKNNHLSDVILANAEALARSEGNPAKEQSYLKGSGWCCSTGSGGCKTSDPPC